MTAEEKLAVALGKAAVCRWVLAFGLTSALEWENGPHGPAESSEKISLGIGSALSRHGHR